MFSPPPTIQARKRTHKYARAYLYTCVATLRWPLCACASLSYTRAQLTLSWKRVPWPSKESFRVNLYSLLADPESFSWRGWMHCEKALYAQKPKLVEVPAKSIPSTLMVKNQRLPAICQKMWSSYPKNSWLRYCAKSFSSFFLRQRYAFEI